MYIVRINTCEKRKMINKTRRVCVYKIYTHTRRIIVIGFEFVEPVAIYIIRVVCAFSCTYNDV